MKKILICIDDSIYSLKVAKEGILLSKKLNAEILLIHVLEGNSIWRESNLPFADFELLKDRAKKLLDKVMDMFNCEAVTFIEEGIPADKIIKTADLLDVDLIALGSHGKTGATKFILGSVAETIIQQARIPVLVVPFKAIDKN